MTQKLKKTTQGKPEMVEWQVAYGETGDGI
jgi:hypothetical protein